MDPNASAGLQAVALTSSAARVESSIEGDDDEEEEDEEEEEEGGAAPGENIAAAVDVPAVPLSPRGDRGVLQGSGEGDPNVEDGRDEATSPLKVPAPTVIEEEAFLSGDPPGGPSRSTGPLTDGGADAIGLPGGVRPT